MLAASLFSVRAVSTFPNAESIRLLSVMDMKNLDEEYLYVNKSCGSVAGIWPYGKQRLKWAGRVIMIFVVVSSLITQIARVVVYMSADTIIEQSPFLLIAVGLVLKETNYIIHEEQLKMLLGCIYDDWSVKRPKCEVDIMHKYAKRGLFFCRLYVANGCFCYVIFTAVALTPRMLDMISPRNESRGVQFIYPAYYALDEEEYYFVIMAHMLTVITVVFFVYISCDTIYMSIVQHACGLLDVSGNNFDRNRFKLAIQADEPSNEKQAARLAQEAYENVCHSVRAHQHAVNYITEVEHVHETYLFIIVALIMLSFSITLVKASTMDPSVEFYKYCGFLVVQLVHLFFLSIQGHFIIVTNDIVFNSIYDGLWYKTSRRAQFLYAMALRRNLTPPVLTAGGLMTLNLESFSEILKASVSYFTVLKSS